MKRIGIWLVMGSVAACSKPEPGGAVAPATARVAAAASSSEGLQSSEPAPAEPSPQVPVAGPSDPGGGPPESFKGGSKESIANAVGLGCEATSLNGWLQLLCRKKNGTGGRPLRAVVHAPGEDAAAALQGREPGSEAPAGEGDSQGEELLPTAQGELTIVVPFTADLQREVAIEWSDTRYTLHVTGPKASLEWAAAGMPHRRACQEVLNESKQALAQAQEAEGDARLTVTEAAKLPRFGVCQAAGLGSWALSLKAVAGQGSGAERLQTLELEVTRVELDGTRRAASFGSLLVAPGGLELGALQVYDYDDDGHDELIVPYEVKATAGRAPALPTPIWTFSDAAVAPYAKAPPVGGGIGVEQLDFDMRPDLGSYGPFVAWLGADCGLKSCPGRVTGPKLYWHGAPDGSFSAEDETVRGALKRACPGKPASVVVETAGLLNAAQTAKNLVCAKLHGVPRDVLAAELTAKRAMVCGEATSCALQQAFDAWLDVAPPLELLTAGAGAKK